MPPTIAASSPPLHVDEDGVIRVGNSRVTLDLVIEAYHLGQTPEYFAEGHETVTLAEVYAAIAYYLANRDELDRYMAEGQRKADELQKKIESQPGYKEWREGLREKLLQRARDRGIQT